MTDEENPPSTRRSLLRTGGAVLSGVAVAGRVQAADPISTGTTVQTTRRLSVSRQPPQSRSAFDSLFGTGLLRSARQPDSQAVPAGATGVVSGEPVDSTDATWWPVCFADRGLGCSWCPDGSLAIATSGGLPLDTTRQARAAAQSGSFQTNQRVRTATSATVRDSPAFDAPGQSVSQGTVGRIRGSTAGDPYSWYRVEFPASTGWLVEPYLEAAPRSEVEPTSVSGTFVRPPRTLSSMKSLIDWYGDLGVNRFMLPIFTRGETLYPSNYVTDQGYSERFLRETIAHAHEQDIEIYGWFHNMYLWNLDAFGELPDGHLLDGTEQVCADGNCLSVDRSLITETQSGRVTAESGKLFGSPFSSQLRQTLANVAREADQRFDLDGLLFDYVRLPKSRTSFGFGRAAEYSGRLSGPARRQQAVTEMVAEVAGAVSPWTTTSAAVFPSYYTKNTPSENNKAQDWRSWRSGTSLDEFVPMCYGFSTYDDQLSFCATVQDGEHAIYPALAVTSGHDSLETQLTAWDDYEFPGYFVWKANQINSELP
jgi:hypothetical protein